MRIEEPRTLAYLHKEHSPDIEAITQNGEYIIKIGGMEIERYEAGDRTTASIISPYRT